jgi:mono/diheme cytochrome c family protein
VACHTIGGGPLVGPDLDGVTERRDRAWLSRWIAEPDKVLAEGDAIATELLQEFNNVQMVNLGLSSAQVEDVLAFLENPGGVVGPSQTAAELLEGDPDRGEAIFTGGTGLQNGAPACISCHSTAGVGLLGGGTLGPDLTEVHDRYGEAGLPQTLQNLPFPTMQGVFGERPLTDNEVADLYAYFVRANQAAARALNYNFILIGLVGFLVLLLISQLIWRKRLKGVRKPLLGEAK